MLVDSVKKAKQRCAYAKNMKVVFFDVSGWV